MKDDIMRAAKKSCHGVYLIINMKKKSSIMSARSDNRSAVATLSPCVLYAGKLKNTARRAISHVNAAVKAPSPKNSKTVKKIRYLLNHGVDIGVVVICLCNLDIAFAVESLLLHDLKHLVNVNKG